MSCERCGSFAINHAAHGRDGSDPSLCDVCYWRQRTEQCTASNAAKDAEIARLREAVRLVIQHDESDPDDGVAMMLAYADALDACRAALAQVAEAWK